MPYDFRVEAMLLIVVPSCAAGSFAAVKRGAPRTTSMPPWAARLNPTRYRVDVCLDEHRALRTRWVNDRRREDRRRVFLPPAT